MNTTIDQLNLLPAEARRAYQKAQQPQCAHQHYCKVKHAYVTITSDSPCRHCNKREGC